MVRNGTPVSQVAKTYGISTASVRIWMGKYPRTKTPKVLREATQEIHITMPPTRDFGKIRDAISTLQDAGLI
jgi:transposase